jgi:NitT/TauT family transport system permease protein
MAISEAARPESRTREEMVALNQEQNIQARKERRMRTVMPLVAFAVVLAAWEGLVRYYEIPAYLIPAPSRIVAAMFENAPELLNALWFTVKLTLISLLLATVGGVLLGSVFALSRTVEATFFPFAVVLQVTPIIAIAPLILVYVSNTFTALLICAWIVAFFPILSNTVIGLRSADHNLRDLFKLYRANRWQMLRFLLVPSALPYFLAGLRIAGGLALIGAVVAEFVAGTSGRNTGLASRIIEATYRNEIPLSFAALFLVSAFGIAIFLVTSALSRRLLGKWHESEVKREV